MAGVYTNVLSGLNGAMESGTASAFNLTGKVAVVTGGNGGIGLAMATGLAKAGAEIAIWARNPEKNLKAVEALSAFGTKVRAYQVDVAVKSEQEAALIATVKDFGGIDIFVPNAGTTLRKKPEQYTTKEFESVMHTNLTAVFEGCNLVYPEMKRRGGGKIIMIGSMASNFGFGISAVYAASKGAIVQYAKSLASAWGKDNIQVNALLPGWIVTEITTQTRSIPGLVDMVLSRTPAGRWGKPDDFEGVATFLSSSASDFVTGAAIPIDGGFSSALFLVDLPE